MALFCNGDEKQRTVLPLVCETTIAVDALRRGTQSLLEAVAL